MNSEHVRLLKNARTYVERGWCQGVYGKKANGISVYLFEIEKAEEVCFVGGLEKAFATGRFKLSTIVDVVDLASRRAEESEYFGSADFNDHIGTNKEEVLTFYDNLILEAQGAQS